MRPPAPYLGGKRRLSARLVALIEQTPHTGYAEVFLGMGGVFLKRRARPKVEVINDLAGDVANLFRILQRHYPQLMDTMRFQVTSRAHYERLVATPADSLTDLERAARFVYLQKLAFGGKVSGRNFGVDSSQSARFNLTRLEPVLADVHERLAGVVIEQLPWQRFLERYDRPGMLFYLDPPYFGGETDYGDGLFERSMYAEMADRLRRLKGRFILSINDRPETRETFAGFALDEASLTYSISGGKGTPARELIVTGP